MLALGTGATTAIFSVVDAVALRPLPFPDPNRIVAVGLRADSAVGGPGGPQRPGPGGPVPGGGPQRPPQPQWAMPGAKLPEPDALMNVTSQNYLDWAAQQQVFESMAAIVDTGDTVLQRPDAELEIVKGQRVTASFFDVLRARPMLGAAFTSQNELAGSDRVVVVSHGFWQRYLGGDPSAVGRSLVLNDEAYTIVGVMPASFAYPPGSSQPADFWTPWVAPQARVGGGGGARALGGGVQAIARLESDVSLDQAQAQMSQVAASDRRCQFRDRQRPPHWHSAASRSPRRQLHAVVDAHAPCRGWHRAAHRVRERREPVAGAGLRAAARCRRACGTRRQSWPTRTARADREPRRVVSGNHRRSRRCLGMRSRACDRFARKPRARGHHRHRYARARGRGCCRAGDGTRLGPRSGAAGIQSRRSQPRSPRAPVAAA